LCGSKRRKEPVMGIIQKHSLILVKVGVLREGSKALPCLLH
jgi:hypothetical protein